MAATPNVREQVANLFPHKTGQVLQPFIKTAVQRETFGNRLQTGSCITKVLPTIVELEYTMGNKKTLPALQVKLII